jgi:hypothetical protein
MPDRKALDRIRPRNRRSQGALLTIVGGIMVGIAGAGVLVYGRYSSMQDREQNWYSAIAVVEDVRTKVAEQVNSNAGGEMRYDAEVLARFSVNGTPQERWIRVEQTPKPLDYIEFESRQWKGKSYFVRWSPTNPDQIVIDIN